MNRRVQSRERYEDDILAFLMDGLLEEEGRALLEENERLNADPAAAIPAELDERCRALLRSAFPDEPLKKPERVTWKIMKRVLIAAVLAATLFATAYAAVPEFRAWILNVFWVDTHNFFVHSSDSQGRPFLPEKKLVLKDGMPFQFTYVPEGWESFYKNVHDVYGIGDDGCIYTWAYGPKDGSESNFSFDISTISGGAGVTVGSDEYQKITVRGYDGFFAQGIDEISGMPYMNCFWLDLENGRMFMFGCIGLSFTEAQKVFDGIVIYMDDEDETLPAPSFPDVSQAEVPFSFSYVPEGYQLMGKEAYHGVLGSGAYITYSWPDSGLNNFHFEVDSISKGQNPVPEPRDTAEVTEMTIHGMPGYFAHGNRHVSDSEFVRYMWFDEERGLRYTYRSMGIPYEESQKIFEGLVIQE